MGISILFISWLNISFHEGSFILVFDIFTLFVTSLYYKFINSKSGNLMKSDAFKAKYVFQNILAGVLGLIISFFGSIKLYAFSFIIIISSILIWIIMNKHNSPKNNVFISQDAFSKSIFLSIFLLASVPFLIDVHIHFVDISNGLHLLIAMIYLLLFFCVLKVINSQNKIFRE